MFWCELGFKVWLMPPMGGDVMASPGAVFMALFGAHTDFMGGGNASVRVCLLAGMVRFWALGALSVASLFPKVSCRVCINGQHLSMFISLAATFFEGLPQW